MKREPGKEELEIRELEKEEQKLKRSLKNMKRDILKRQNFKESERT